MAVFKCKMCGGALEISEDITVAECEYCGSKQTVPTKKDEVITNLFNRANNLRLKNEFDKATEVYSKILNENDADAEAHWGLVLCKYGIEYIEDPKTYKRIPTCHRTQYTSVLSDSDYLAALENADAVSKEVYATEAREIAELQKSILAIVKDEKPFDVFICYKETDDTGKRTVDSTLANDIYYQLTKEGLRVFYAAITLEDKLGVEYEPYIFAALNSAKVMLAIGTKPEYFNAVWVKNEWSRYLGIMKTDREKMLIPCYRDMDAYDLPEEFAHLQAQDMSKIGFINDLVRGIKKVTQADDVPATVVKETVVVGENANTAPLLERVFMFLEDGDWNSADEYCEKVLDIDPKNAQAYLGKLMVELRVRKQESLKDQAEPFDESNNYQKVFRFGDDDLKKMLAGYIEHIIIRNENTRLDLAYESAKRLMASATSEDDYKKAALEFKVISNWKDSASLAEGCLVKAKNAAYSSAKDVMKRANSEEQYKFAARKFKELSDWRDSASLLEECLSKAEDARKDAILDKAKSLKGSKHVSVLAEAIVLLKPISGWKDSDEIIVFCEEKIAKLQEEAVQKKAELEKTKKQIIKKLKIATPIVTAVIILLILLNNVIIPNAKYNNAISLMEEGKYSEAVTAFEALEDYKDSAIKIVECKFGIKDGKYNDAIALMNEKKYDEAIAIFEELDGYKDSDDKIEECENGIKETKYNNAGRLVVV